MFEKEIKLIALFFFFAVLDDKKAVVQASHAVDLFYLHMKKNPTANTQAVLIAVTKQVWDQTKDNLFRGRPQYSKESGWILPTRLDLSPWKEFQKSAHEEELLSVVWSKILNVEDEDISKALGLREGTIRYRVGRGLRKLGNMTQNFKKNLEAVRSDD